ncbi:MAG: hypothetical protein ABL934_09165 [Lysobacteraceae bacterium]
MSILVAITAALAAVTAALIAGFFSYSNIISSKENKVSEFRLSWLNELRNEIADYTSAVQDLARLQRLESSISGNEKVENKSEEERKTDRYKLRKDAFDRAVVNLSKIQLRLNPEKISLFPDSDEAVFFRAVVASKELINLTKYKEAIFSCQDIRDKAAPILKSTWVTVRDGEEGYKKTKKIAKRTLICGILFLLLGYFVLVGIAVSAGIQSSSQSDSKVITVISR